MRSVALAAVIVAASTAAGCDRSDDCVARTRRLEEQLSEIPAGGRRIREDVDWLTGVTLAPLADEVAAVDDVEHLPSVVFIRPGGVSTGPARTVAEAMVGLREVVERTGSEDPVLLVPDRDAAWVHVATALEALRELDRTRVDVLLRREIEIPPPALSSITPEINALGSDSAQRVTRGASLAARVFEPCPEIERMFTDQTSVTGDFAAYTAGIGEALRECGCKADVDAVASISHYLFAPDFVPAIVRLSLAAKGVDVERLVFDSTATWEEVSAEVVAARDQPVAYSWK